MKNVIIVLFLVVFLSCNSEYVEFQKIDWNQMDDFIIEKEFTGHFQENIIFVLDFFSEDYYIKDGKLYITRKLWNDKNKLWNYCNKANGDKWINTRKEMLQGVQSTPQ